MAHYLHFVHFRFNKGWRNADNAESALGYILSLW